MLEAFHSYFKEGLASGYPSFHQRRQFFALSLFYLSVKGTEVVLRRVVPPLFSVLTAVVGSSVMVHVVEVVREKEMEKACWKTDGSSLVRASVILLDKGPYLAPKCWRKILLYHQRMCHAL